MPLVAANTIQNTSSTSAIGSKSRARLRESSPSAFQPKINAKGRVSNQTPVVNEYGEYFSIPKKVAANGKIGRFHQRLPDNKPLPELPKFAARRLSQLSPPKT